MTENAAPAYINNIEWIVSQFEAWYTQYVQSATLILEKKTLHLHH